MRNNSTNTIYNFYNDLEKFEKYYPLSVYETY